MGSFSYSCQISGLPITSGAKAGLILLKLKEDLYEHSEESLRQYGKVSLVTNDGPCAKFTPIAFPIFGTYDEYGGLENIIEDANSKVLEEYFGFPIQELVEIVTSGRKDDGYDECLTALKDPNAPERDSNGRLDATYQEKYKELLSLSALIVRACSVVAAR